MARQRRIFDAHFKSQVVLEVLKERQTLNELASRFDLTPQTVSLWKQHLLEHLPGIFQDKRRKREAHDLQTREAELYQQIGQLKMEVEWLKKKLNPRP